MEEPLLLLAERWFRMQKTSIYKLRYIFACVSVLIIFSSSIITPVAVFAETEAPTPVSTPVLAETATTPTTVVPTSTEPPVTSLSTEAPTNTPTTSESTYSSSAAIETTASQQTESSGATLTGNDDIGTVVTGDTTSDIEILNQADNITALGGDVTLLTTTPINGQDYLVNPQQNATTTIPNTPSGDVAITNDTTILNIVVTDSTSGNVVATKNDDIGAISTGNALSSVEILNLANNIVATGDIFVGSITIDDGFKNNIVLSNMLLDHLINGTANTTQLFTGNLTTDSLQVVTNTVDASAKSGDIQATKNDDIGASTTGAASTNIDIENTLGNYVIKGNALLVIITTTGDWGGSLLGNKGAYIALLTLDANGNPVISSPIGGLAEQINNLSVKNNTTITNTVSATASSGSIQAEKNDDIGAMTTGDATVNIAIRNVLTNIVSISDWFGIVFINVFGEWNGNVVMQQRIVPAPLTNKTSGAIGPPPVAAVASYTNTNTYSYVPTVANTTTADTPASTFVAAAITNPFTKFDAPSPDNSLLWLVFIAIISGGLIAGQRVFVIRQASL